MSFEEIHLDGLDNNDNNSISPNSENSADNDTSSTIFRASDNLSSKVRDSEHLCSEVRDSEHLCNKLFNVKIFLVLMCIFSITQGFAINGINNVNIPMYERRFELTSTQSGLEASFYDIVAGLTVLIIGYYGIQFHQPRLLGLASCVLSIGSLTLALPHFTTGYYRPTNIDTSICQFAGNNSISSNLCDIEDTGLSNYLHMLLLGQGLHGLAGAVLFTIGPAYIDGSVAVKHSPTYLGIFYGASALGPALGYMLGGWFLEQYVDIPYQPPHNMTPLSPGWVGAWWIGFLISFVSCFLLIFPLCLFPRVLPGTNKRWRYNIDQAHDHGLQHKVEGQGFGLSIRDMPTALIILLKNPVFVSQCIVSGCEGMIISGMSTFLPKFIANQFNQKASWASMLTGLLAVPAAAAGQMLGGVIIRKFRLKVQGIIRFNLGCSVAVVIFASCFWVKCQQDKIVGVTNTYTVENISAEHTVDLSSIHLAHQCNSHCSCTTELYDPVCIDGKEYFTACYAGCGSSNTTTGQLEFDSCSCVTPSVNNGSYKATVEPGKCGSGCNMLYVFASVGFFAFFATFMMSVPGTTVILRCVNDKQRTFALSIQQMSMRLIGSIPGPILFGTVLDMSCLVWQEKCNDRGSCWIYDNDKMGRNFYIIMISVKIVSIVCLIVAQKLYIAPTNTLPPQLTNHRSTRQEGQ